MHFVWHLISTWYVSVQNSRKLKARKERTATTSNSSIVGTLWCHLDCSLALFLVCSRSGSSTASLCLYFLQLCAFVEDFFIVMILLLGSGYTQQLNCYESEITHTCSVQTCHCQTYSPCLIHNYQVLISQSFTKLWRQSQQLCCKHDVWHNFSRTLLWL